MSIRLFSLLIVVASGASSLAEGLPATEVTRIVRHLMELAWGEELSRIRYVDTSPNGGSQSVVTKLIEIQGQNKRWEIVQTDEDRVKTMVIGANAQYAFYVEQPAFGAPWKLMDFLPEGQAPERGRGIKYALEREIRTIQRIPYGFTTKVINADFLERFGVRATRNAETKTTNDEIGLPLSPRLDRSLVLPLCRTYWLVNMPRLSGPRWRDLRTDHGSKVLNSRNEEPTKSGLVPAQESNV